ncbi:MAG TPA: zinc dependent phospholipase C family protein [Longimicrobiaceae bacterium]
MKLTAGGLLAAAGIALLLVALTPDHAYAWGPGTHAYLSWQVLQSLQLLPDAIRTVLAAYPYDFIYGSLAADISLAKKYVPEGRHCHHWHVGEEIEAAAGSERLKAVGIGYLTHLAADTIAHNFYVPRQLLLTSSTKGLGHSYWEARMDRHMGDEFTRLAREAVTQHDHSQADALFDEVLSGTLFSFRTNRRIFRGLIRFQDNDRWQSIFGTLVTMSRWELTDETVHQYVVRSFDYVIDYLQRRGQAIPRALDPIGERNLELSKKVRRMALQDGAAERPELLEEMADEFFPLPDIPFGHLVEKPHTNGQRKP